MIKIDVHTHILPKELPNMREISGYGGWLSLHDLGDGKLRMMLDDKFFREVEPNCYSPKVRIQECNAHGVSIQVLSTVPVLFSYWAKPKDCLFLARYLNDHIAQTVQENPDRFWGLATLPMQDPELAVLELERCMNELGFKGIQIGSHINEWNLDAPQLHPVWSACEQMDVPIFVHPWDMDTSSRMSDYWFPWLIGMPCETTVAIASLMMGGVLEKFPKLRVSFAHGCGSFPYTASRIQHGHAVRPDLCAHRCQVPPLDFVPRIWSDSLVHDQDSLQFLAKKLHIDRIMLGSDYPFPLGEHWPGKMVEEATNLSLEEKQKVLGLNAIEFFNKK